MKPWIRVIGLISGTVFLAIACTRQQSTLVLEPQQTMSVSGLGPGQNAAINPYADGPSVLQVKNIGNNALQVRLEAPDQPVTRVEVQAHTSTEIELVPGVATYLESEDAGKARVSFRKG